MALRVEQVDGQAFTSFSRASGTPLPIEQSPVWDAFDDAVPERAPWRRLALLPPQSSTPVALISLSRYRVRSFQYLWARHGPVWLTEPTAELERLARAALTDYVRAHAPEAVFIRMHARHPGRGLHELLQTITYDRTVVIDLTRTEEEIFASFSKRRRARIRKALGDPAFDLREESGLSQEQFQELYAIYQETAERDEFGIYGADTYYTMIAALGPHARVFVARRTDEGAPGSARTPGRAVAWVIVTVYDRAAVSYYAGATAEARETNAVVLLRWHVMRALKQEGVLAYDLMGVDSPRAPSLKGVGDFKRQFGPEVAVDGAWDVPLRPWHYRALACALRVKRALRR